MDINEMDELILLKHRVEEIIGRYRKLELELENVRLKNLELTEQLNNKESEVNNIKDNFDRIKLSGALRGENEDSLEARKRVNKLVREIDNCIALLNNI